jgi:serine/threonine protein kinase
MSRLSSNAAAPACHRYALVMEYHPRGTLLHALGSSGRQAVLSWQQRLQLATQVALGLAHLHQQGIAHGGLKSSNVLISTDGKVCKP